MEIKETLQMTPIRLVLHRRLAWFLTASMMVFVFWYTYYDIQKSVEITDEQLKSTDFEQLKSADEVPVVVTSSTSQDEMTSRVVLLRSECAHFDVQNLQRTWYTASNRQHHCSSMMCPLVVNEERFLLMCFIPKVAGTSVKQLFLDLENKMVDDFNSTIFNLEADFALLRVSPSFYPEHKMFWFYKGLFVRHPFDRLVSAYVDKVAPGRKTWPYFYDHYFIPAMKKFRGKVTDDDIMTFNEFVEYLITTQPRDYNEHWVPYWSRCDVCRISYDFVGRLESAEQDVELLKQQVGIQGYNFTITNESNRAKTNKYFGDLTENQIIELYKIYFLDFKLFGYDVDEFLPVGTDVESIDESFQLDGLIY